MTVDLSEFGGLGETGRVRCVFPDLIARCSADQYEKLAVVLPPKSGVRHSKIAERLSAWIEQGGWTTSALTNDLLPMTAQAVGRHRRGQCACRVVISEAWRSPQEG